MAHVELMLAGIVTSSSENENGYRWTFCLQMRGAGEKFADRDSQPPEETLRIFEEMLAGSAEGQAWCLRVKVTGLKDKAGKVIPDMQVGTLGRDCLASK